MGQIFPSPTAEELLEEIRKYFPNAQITLNPDPKAMDILKTIPKKLDDREARIEWEWSIRYGLKEMVEDFIKEFNPNFS